ncbi:MAG TPA: hypothetical protein VNY27_03030 [Solirubrobacteraceae bacterium]|jgi:hypothetical protein|nr:hypothetical protein [Solirubrobacteraceae bacterium]
MSPLTAAARKRVYPVRLLLVTASVVVGLAAAAPAGAAADAPRWEIQSISQPTNFAPGDTSGNDTYVLTAINIGNAATDGSDTTITDMLPSGLTATSVNLFAPQTGPGFDLGSFLCTTTPVQCHYPGPFGGALGPIQPQRSLELIVHVSVDPNAAGPVTNSVTMSGGGAPDASVSSTNEVSDSPAPFGIQDGGVTVLNQDGSPDTQAGSYPYSLNTTFAFPTALNANGNPQTTAIVKDTAVDLPVGLVGSATVVPTCPEEQVKQHSCPAGSQVGVARFRLSSNGGPRSSGTVPVYSVPPRPGTPAEFAFHPGATISALVSVRPGDRGLETTVENASATFDLFAVRLTIWGVPADPSHDPQRCGGPDLSGTCTGQGGDDTFPHTAGIPPLPFLRNPTSCGTTALTATIRADSYQAPGAFFSKSSDLGQTTGCADLPPFAPSLTVKPDSTVADSPTGLSSDLTTPQNTDPLPIIFSSPGNNSIFPVGLDYSSRATSDLRDAVVTFPEGVSISPSAASGLQACSDAQLALASNDPASCPASSKIGTVTLTTPALPDQLTGSIYVGQPLPGDRYRIFLEFAGDGVRIKLVGSVHPDPVTGQLTTTFLDNPQLPFSRLHLQLFGGPRAVFATPESCGSFGVTSDLLPWDGGAGANPVDSFTIDNGCVSGFNPSFTAGTQNAQAGAYSPFVLSFSRSDTDQELSGLTVKLPPGMLAKLAGVQECSDAQLAAAAAMTGTAEQANPSCPSGSQVGTVQAGAGPGSEPFFLPGKAYLTGPYRGAPYGIAVVVPTLAGPYDFGSVVVRQALFVDPTTAQVTAISDPFPTILQGVPLKIRTVNVTLDRTGFTFNPTNCNPMAVNATLTSTGGLSAAVSSRFQVAGCAALAFAPKFSASTQARTSRTNGASLDVKIGFAAGQANIRSVKVDLPKQLPSRLTTLQKACTDAVFNANPAGCPAASLVGTATAVTPLLGVPLTGPAYFVSHGGAAFPQLIMVLQGAGITVDLAGDTFINSKGITSSTFRSVPDVPVSSFEIKLPEGPYSALAANANLCSTTSTVTVKKRVTRRIHGKRRRVLRSVKQKVAAPLLMPTTITAQNGAVIKQTTKIAVTGCLAHRAKKAKKAQRSRHRSKHR